MWGGNSPLKFMNISNISKYFSISLILIVFAFLINTVDEGSAPQNKINLFLCCFPTFKLSFMFVFFYLLGSVKNCASLSLLDVKDVPRKARRNVKQFLFEICTFETAILRAIDDIKNALERQACTIFVAL